MNYLDHLRARVSAADTDNRATTAVLEDLLTALEAGGAFTLDRLYALPYADFEVALGALREWWACRRLEGLAEES
jgi:DNA-binding transcriptional regulator YbjK